MLPALIGTGKQVTWATSIRVLAVANLTAATERATRRNLDSAPTLCAWVEAVKAKVSAAWWIDNRAMLPVCDWMTESEAWYCVNKLVKRDMALNRGARPQDSLVAGFRGEA